MASSSNNFGTTIEQRLLPDIELFRILKELVFQQLRVAVPAVVLSFDAGPPATVKLAVAIRDRVQHSVPISGPLSPVTDFRTLPVMDDVPVVVYGAGGWSVTIPIQPGDECLAVFSDSCLDAWLQNGAAIGSDGLVQSQVPMSPRRHNLSDAIAIFGLRSTPNGLSDYSLDSMQLRNKDGSVVIDLADDQVTITAPTVSVNCTTLTADCSGSAQVTAPSVVLGSAASHADFMLHEHYNVAGPVTGMVVPQP